MRDEQDRYSALVERLYRQNERVIKLGLEPFRNAVRALGLPKPAPCVVLVAGTNGKGGVCALVNAMAMSAGLRTALYTSPHLVDVRERIRFDGRPIGRDEFVERTTRAIGRFGEEPSRDGLARPLTYFELLTLVAWEAAAARRDVDVAIFDVGLGGRLDATNVVEPDVTAITALGLDHQQWLGSSIEAIAAEKAGICRPGLECVYHRGNAGADVVLEAIGDARGLPVAVGRASGVGVGQRNEEVAAQIMRECGRRLGVDRQSIATAISSGSARARWPGRRSTHRRGGVTWLVDGAHNRQAVEETVRWIHARDDDGSRIDAAVVAVARGRDPAELFAPLRDRVDAWLVVDTKSGRTKPPDDVIGALRGAGYSNVAHAGSIRAAHERFDGGARVFVGGSLYLVGELYEAWGMTAESLDVMSGR